ncbi:hypothetical protein B0H14DRAFT_2588059 [Mycena olivaceomarginata]|nr:hypothetical protein B0H14DRAFT_2588059 [Mycena olivaceomarginata]
MIRAYLRHKRHGFGGKNTCLKVDEKKRRWEKGKEVPSHVAFGTIQCRSRHRSSALPPPFLGSSTSGASCPARYTSTLLLLDSFEEPMRSRINIEQHQQRGKRTSSIIAPHMLKQSAQRLRSHLSTRQRSAKTAIPGLSPPSKLVLRLRQFSLPDTQPAYQEALRGRIEAAFSDELNKCTSSCNYIAMYPAMAGRYIGLKAHLGWAAVMCL